MVSSSPFLFGFKFANSLERNEKFIRNVEFPTSLPASSTAGNESTKKKEKGKNVVIMNMVGMEIKYGARDENNFQIRLYSILISSILTI